MRKTIIAAALLLASPAFAQQPSQQAQYVQQLAGTIFVLTGQLDQANAHIQQDQVRIAELEKKVADQTKP
jgi:hypothetical protein